MNIQPNLPYLEYLEEKSFEEDDSNEVPPSDVIAYNELRSCADLYRMYDQKILNIKPDFQRDVVWSDPAQTRFIDSLIKQLPIPSMCFSLDYKTRKWLVIDGLQRISSIIKFLEGDNWKLSNLDDITPEISGTKAADLKNPSSKLHKYYQLVENLTIPVTVIRCDYTKKDHMEYLFTIFHRLNSGGMKLNNQEIRNCIFGGDFNALLQTLDEYKPWRRVNKMKAGDNYRLRKQEMILRFFSFSDNHKKYNGSLVRFLNDYMQENKNPTSDFLSNKETYFKETVSCIYDKIFDNSSPKAKLSITLLEALLVGVGKNIDTLKNKSSNELKIKYDQLKQHEHFSKEFILEGLSKKQRVINRLDTAIEIFS